jgi:hypothetical protein
MLIVTGTIALFVLSRPDPRVLFGAIGLCLTLLMKDDDRPTMRARAAAGAAAALTSIIKFSCLVAALPVALLTAVQDIRRKRFPVAGTSFAGGLLVFWLLGGQRLSDLPAWLRNSVEIVSGYTPVMTTVEGPGALALIGFVATALLVLVAVASPAGSPEGEGTWLAVPGVAWVTFALSKASFVRYDQEHLSTVSIGLVFLALGTFSLTRGSVQRWRTTTATIALIVSIASAWMPLRAAFGMNPASALVDRASARLQHLASPPSGDDETAKIPLDTDIASIDLYSVGQRAALKQQIPYRPRPVFQSYSAYTKRLLELNARHLESPQAAETLLLLPVTIDGRYPSFDDSLSYPLFMSHYEVTGMDGDWLRLDRRTTPAPVVMGSPTDLTAQLGAVVPMPDEPALLWAEIDVEPTLPCRILSAAYRAPLLFMIVERADRGLTVHRFAPSIAKAGFLLSPVTDSPDALASAISRTMPRDSRVRSIMIRPDDPNDIGHFWKRDFRIRVRPIPSHTAGELVEMTGTSPEE